MGSRSASSKVTWDIAIFAALGVERRVVAGALRDVAEAGSPRCWKGRLGDGASCLVVQTGIGCVRARAAAAAVPGARLFLSCGWGGALAPRLEPGDLVIADSIFALDRTGKPRTRLPAAEEPLAAWARAHGFRAHRGSFASSMTVLGVGGKRAAAGTGALVVDMESAGVANAARARGIPFVGLRTVLDRFEDEVAFAADLIDPVEGEVQAGRGIAALALRPWRWPLTARLARQSRSAERELSTFLGAVLGAGLSALAPFAAEAETGVL